MSNLCWSFAIAGHKAEELFASVAGQHLRIARDGNNQNLANIALAFAKLDCKAETLFASIAGEHKRIVGSGDVQVSAAKRASLIIRQNNS